jgi:hypothetical protein
MQPPLTSSRLRPYILLRTLFAVAPTLCFAFTENNLTWHLQNATEKSQVLCTSVRCASFALEILGLVLLCHNKFRVYFNQFRNTCLRHVKVSDGVTLKCVKSLFWTSSVVCVIQLYNYNGSDQEFNKDSTSFLRNFVHLQTEMTSHSTCVAQ